MKSRAAVGVRSIQRMGCLAACALVAAFLSGCAQGDGQPTRTIAVEVANPTTASMEFLVKVWDHNGVLVFDQSTTLAPGQAATGIGSFQGEMPKYGARYTWFAQAADLQRQVERSPEGVATWGVDVRESGIEFRFVPPGAPAS